MTYLRFALDIKHPRARWPSLVAVLGCLLFGVVNQALSQVPDDDLLRRADNIKSASRTEFRQIVEGLAGRTDELSIPQRHYLNFLQGWQFGYEGDYDAALVLLRRVSNESNDVTLRFRAYASSVNVLAISKRYEEAFSSLSRLIELLPQVTDRDARSQGIGVAMLLYNQVGQYELSLSYANEELSDRGACTVGETRIQALYKSKKIRPGDSEFRSVVDACEKAGEPVFAHLVRTYLARSYIDERRFIEAINLLRDHYDEVVRTQYPPLVSTYDALLAHLYRETGDAVLAKRFALHAIDSAVKNAYTEPLANAYRLMYVLSKEQGDLKSALSFHEKYVAVDKGYLDDVTARQLAYQRVKQEVEAGRLQIDALNRQNEVLQLQQQLSKKAVENIRLYIALLAVSLIFIVLWAYRTKRSQMHFKKLSRRDGLTGIYNRPHFIELCEASLKTARKNRQDVCIVLCDLDHFKSVNDNFGHAEGDYVLQRAVTACQMYLRATDVFARIGGEEFGVLLPACNLDDARVRVERLRVAVAESNPSDGKFQVSASFGIACAGVSGYDLQTLMTHADAALYKAKRSGRNCVMAYDQKENEAATPRVVYVEGVRT